MSSPFDPFHSLLSLPPPSCSSYSLSLYESPLLIHAPPRSIASEGNLSFEKKKGEVIIGSRNFDRHRQSFSGGRSWCMRQQPTGDSIPAAARLLEEHVLEDPPQRNTMSLRPDGKGRDFPALGLGLDPDHLREALSLEGNKPDTRNPLALSGLGSPVSPLRTGPAPAVSSSSSSSAGSAGGGAVDRKPVHSGELSSSTAGTTWNSTGSSIGSERHGHQRSGSGPLIYAGGKCGGSSTATSPATNVLPAGNICPSGKIAPTGMIPRNSSRSDVLGSGTANYGHGSILSSAAPLTKLDVAAGNNLQQIINAGNEFYKKGHHLEALRCYDKAVQLSPENASCRSNRAAALIGAGRLGDAARECEEVVRIDPGNTRAHHRLATVYLRLGMLDNARKHFGLSGHGMHDPAEWQKLQEVDKHFARCMDARKAGDWKTTLREADAAIAAGADSSVLLSALRAEALLRLHKLDDADSTLSSSSRLRNPVWSSSLTMIFGMLSDAYVHIIRAQVDMALGRFDDAIVAAEKAKQIDSGSMEVSTALNIIRLVVRARARGNELFNVGSFAEASIAYGEGLKYEPLNPVLYCNRAACWSKMGKWEKSVQDCDEALKIQPRYTKALLRRAASNAKLERWSECIRDYESLRKEIPGDKDVAEALFHAQVALKTSRGEEISNMKFGGEVEQVANADQFRAAISLPGVSVVYFMASRNQQCEKATPFVDALCKQYPSTSFLKVNIDKSPAIARSEGVQIVPSFKIYKNGVRVKEMICPTIQVLECSVRHYSL